MLNFLLTYEIAQRSLATGLLVGLIAPLTGVFIVARRLSVVSEVLSHMSLAGIAAGLTLGSFFPLMDRVNPILFGILFAVLAAFVVEWLRKAYAGFSEISIPIMLSLAIGSAAVLFSYAGGFNVDLASYLFGNLLGVTSGDFRVVAGVSTAVLIVLILFYKELLLLMFDEEFAKTSGIRGTLVHFVFVLLGAFTVAVSVRAVGVMLVTGLMVLPVASAMLLARGFKQMMFLSLAYSEGAIIVGFIASYYLSLASGGTIILTALIMLIFTILMKKWFVAKRLKIKTLLKH